MALKEPSNARLFQHYISSLAPQYDLSDTFQSFTKEVPRHALDNPLLFGAVIAFAAIHLSCTTAPSMREAAEQCHATCVRQLIDLDEASLEGSQGIVLAAICLLRSYEIIAEAFDPNRHLSGAYAFADAHPLDSATPSLWRAGYFNFLREDITFSLMNQCALKIDPAKLDSVYQPITDEDHVNLATLILGQAVNACFSNAQAVAARNVVASRLESWHQSLPPQIQPYHDTTSDHSNPSTFPTIRMLHDSHVAALQYEIVAQSVLASVGSGSDPSSASTHLETLAVRLCGLAFTSSSSATLVNSYGPISFCGRYIQQPALRDELIRRLLGSKKQTGWPVQRLVDELRQHWHVTEKD